MKSMRIVAAALLVCMLFSNCAAIKNRRCDCPKFSQAAPPTEQVAETDC